MTFAAVAVASPAWLALCLQAAGSPAPPAPDLESRLVFEISAPIDLFFFVRARAAPLRPDEPPLAALEGFEPAIEAVAELERELEGSFLAWGPLEGSLAGARTLDDVERAFADLPETFEPRPGKKVALRERALAIAEALREVEPRFRAEAWPAHEAAIDEARARIARDFAPKEAACLAFHLESLGMEDPALDLPVVLVAEAPFPGAVTHRGPQGRGVSFVAVNGVEGTQLFETALHEATHSLDVATRGASVLEDLRARLAKAGLGPRDRALRDLPHTLMFVQSAESIRRTVDPEHRDYGDVAGYYARVPEASLLVRPAWQEHLAGKLTREEALERIAGGAAGPR